MKRFILFLLALCLPSVALAQSYTLSPPPFLQNLDLSGVAVNNGCIWTYQAGTTTPIATYSTSGGVANTNPIRSGPDGTFVAYLVVGNNYKFVYENSDCSPPSHGTVIRTQDNIQATPASAATVDQSGTAGENLLQGQCAYLSDGEGSKNAGQWYKCDSTNIYSSVTPEVGITLAAISSGNSGSFRLLGAVTGLSALTQGAEYFASTSGNITATPTANRRHLGHADSTTTLVLTSDPPIPPAGFFNDFRLSLTTATCITTSDVTAATTLYLTPCYGNRITLFNTNGGWETCTTAEISIAVPASTSQMYDVWAYDSTWGTCTVTLELLAWTNDTTRATAIARSSGRYTKSGDTSRMYVGSFRTTGSSGQTEDSFAKRYVWNYYNRVGRLMRVVDATDSWNYNSGTWRSGDNNAANQLDFVVGVAEVQAEANLLVYALQGASITAFVGIGYDSTTTPDAGALVGPQLMTNFSATVSSALKKYPAVGRHTLNWLEKTAGGQVTFYGDNGADGTQSGIHGVIQG